MQDTPHVSKRAPSLPPPSPFLAGRILIAVSHSLYAKPFVAITRVSCIATVDALPCHGHLLRSLARRALLCTAASGVRLWGHAKASYGKAALEALHGPAGLWHFCRCLPSTAAARRALPSTGALPPLAAAALRCQKGSADLSPKHVSGMEELGGGIGNVGHVVAAAAVSPLPAVCFLSAAAFVRVDELGCWRAARLRRQGPGEMAADDADKARGHGAHGTQQAERRGQAAVGGPAPG
mmetsp:Transcript_1928/g.5675  ORF Transcript_1928/g.5675 Transcript_1928/m.5675 type:complete len:237 (+) Transcript_1928:129-839(+)